MSSSTTLNTSDEASVRDKSNGSASVTTAEEGSGSDGLGGGMKAEQDLAVHVTDFAGDSGGQSGGDGKQDGSRTPSPPSRAETPKTGPAWDSFIDQYMSGETHHLDFSLPERRMSSPSSATAVPDYISHSLHPISPPKTSSIPLGNTASPLNLRGQGHLNRSKTPSPLNSSDEGGFKDSHRITSSSGQANQDPRIPNIAGHNSDSDGARDRQEARKSSMSHLPGQQLTREHMAQLGVQHKEAADEADGEDSPGMTGEERKGRDGSSLRNKRVKRTRRPMDAELGSARAAHSVGTTSSDEDVEAGGSSIGSRNSRRTRPPLPPSKRSHRITAPSIRPIETPPLEALLAESESHSVASQPDIDFDYGADRTRVREFFEKHGYMPAPRQTPDAARRRLRVIRRLGLEKPDELHSQTLDRFTRLAVSIFKTKRALVSIIGRDRQIFLSEIGMGAKSTSFEDAFCCHTVIGNGESCMVIPDAANDWRFAKNPLVKDGAGIIQFYAGAPLRVGKGPKSAIIGSMCIIDDQPRHNFDEEGKRLLQDLAECAVSELELLYNQQATVEAAKLHQISVDFLRRSLKHRPTERAGQSRQTATATTQTSTLTGSSTSGSASKRNSGADSKQLEEDIDIFDEACQEIRLALKAHAVAIVDLTQFHLFYPSYQTSTAGGSRSGGGSQSFGAQSRAHTPRPGQSSRSYTASRAEEEGEEAEPYQKAPDGRAARKTYAVVDPMSAGRTPQVLFVPSSGTTTGRSSDNVPKADAANNLPILGYSCNEDNFAFNFSATPAGRKIVCDFIARNVKGRTVWYSRDDSEGVAESITHLMPPGTEASLAMPVFGYDGQVAFAVVGCWTDPLFSYPAGALQFVETIAGSLLASVMKERLHQAERAQLNFAAAASHELRTPLHQLNAAAALLRQALSASLVPSPNTSPVTSPPLGIASPSDPLSSPQTSPRKPSSSRISRDDRKDAAAHLEVIEANGEALGQILENIIDTLDIGRAISTGRPNGPNQTTTTMPAIPEEMHNLSDVLEGVVKDAIMMESKARRVAGEKGLEDVEILLEVMPRLRGRWILATDPGPLSRALSKIVNNACKFTDKGYIHITVQDMSRDVALPGGYDNSIKLSQVVIDIKDTGRGMSPDFLDQTILRPFAKADPFMPGAGLGLGLAQRMIEILGGKLAIKSTLGKGTLVHIELPLHLLNTDNESDLDDLIRQSDHYTVRTFSPSRQDGIFLHGFDDGEPGLRRVGRTLLRQLKLRFCRVVDKPQFASLIVIPDGRFTEDQIKELVLEARPDVEVISLLSTKQALTTSHQIAAPSLGETSTVNGAERATALEEQIKITYLKRPLFPSVIRRIVRPPRKVEQPNEVYKSDVVGGDEAREERGAGGGGGLLDADTEIAPSPLLRPDSPGGELDGSLMLSDRWSGSSHSGSAGARTRESSWTNQSEGLPTSPTGFIEDTAASPTVSGRPHIETHITEPPPQLHDSLARMSLKTIHSDETLMTVTGDDSQPSALKVLVVEDNAVNRRIVVAMLKRTACRYAEAVDGEDAVQKFLSFSPDLCLLDLQMPKKDGFQAAAEIRAIESKRGGSKRVKIIAVTALSQENAKRRGMLECGIDEWRTKPVSLKTLKEDVERMRE